MMDIEERKVFRGHILAVPYPSQGHVNPMLQFCKRLTSKSTKTTLAITNFISNSMKPKSDAVILETISDGCDDGGFMQAESVADYLRRMEIAGSKTLEELIIVKKYGIKGACFFTQACAVNYVYYYVHHGLLQLPVPPSVPVEIPGLPLLELQDMPSFIYVHGSYPAYFEMVLNQFSNVDKADFVLVNTYYKLEEKVVETMTKVSPVITIGPTVPSFYLDKRVENDNDYGLHLFQLDPSISINWLNNKPTESVIYISFGSMATFQKTQIEEIAWGLKNTNFSFLWVVKDSDRRYIPDHFLEETSDRGFIINWSPQINVLSNKAIGCFFSHGGWNSTIEALSMGVPMVVMPQWTDQTTNAKLVQDVWRIGVRVKVDANGIVGREEIENCIRQVTTKKTLNSDGCYRRLE